MWNQPFCWLSRCTNWIEVLLNGGSKRWVGERFEWSYISLKNVGLVPQSNRFMVGENRGSGRSLENSSLPFLGMGWRNASELRISCSLFSQPIIFLLGQPNCFVWIITVFFMIITIMKLIRKWVVWYSYSFKKFSLIW